MIDEQPSRADVGNDFDSGLYFVAVLDILGQRNALSGLTWPLLNLPNPEEAANRYRKSVGDVTALQSVVWSFYHGAKGGLQGLEADAIPRPELQFQMFGDSVVPYVRLDKSSNPLPGVYVALGACAAAILSAFSRGYSLRGAVDVGLANEIRRGEIYGPAPSNAHYLESKVAEYPRIVAGEGLSRYLDEVRAKARQTGQPQPTEYMVDSCRKLLMEDVDGLTVLDYLNVWGAQEYAPKGYEYLRQEHGRFKKSNAELALRYSLALGYFESRSHLWKPRKT